MTVLPENLGDGLAACQDEVAGCQSVGAFDLEAGLPVLSDPESGLSLDAFDYLGLALSNLHRNPRLQEITLDLVPGSAQRAPEPPPVEAQQAAPPDAQAQEPEPEPEPEPDPFAQVALITEGRTHLFLPVPHTGGLVAHFICGSGEDPAALLTQARKALDARFPAQEPDAT